ncbi:MAG: hypothetical protein R2708_28555, partial [Vicinamibacterales bacterium]
MTVSRPPRQRWTGLTVLALAVGTWFQVPGLEAQRPRYRFVEVRTIAGPCCTDEGVAIEVDAEGGILVAGQRGSLDLDHDGTIDVRT